MTSEIKVDTISENTSANGVTIDGLTIKDGNIIGDVALAGTTPTFTIGDAGAEDASLIFDGNAQDFYVALDDSADDLVIGLGNTVGTTPIMSFDESKNVTIHDGTLKVESDNANALVAPLLQLDRISSSPADGDLIGAIRYTGRLDNGNSAEFAGLEAKIIESSTADGEITLNIAKGGNVRSAVKANNTEVIINDASEDIDFRVESNGNANMLFVDGGNDKVGIGTASPASKLEVEDSVNGDMHLRINNTNSGNAARTFLLFESDNGTASAYLNGSNKSGSGVDQADSFTVTSDSTVSNGLNINAHSGNIKFYTGYTERMRITDGGLAIGGTGAANTLDDYEEGTWTFGMNVGGVAISLSKSEGRYVKVGNLVHVQAYIVVSNLNSQTGALNGTGLPFAASNANSGYSSTCTGFSTSLALPVHDSGDNASFSATFAVSVDKNATTMFLRRQGDSGGGHNQTIAATQISVDGEFMFQFSYTTF